MYYTMLMVNDRKCREGFDLSALKCIIVGGNLAGQEFKQKLLELAPQSIVSLLYALNYAWMFSHVSDVLVSNVLA